MALELPGHTIDVHGGGDALLFHHHACEVSQSESLTGVSFVNHFMHVAPVAYQGEKMSKSLGNLVYADTIIREIGEICTRMMLLSHHYREGYEYTQEDAQLANERCPQWSEGLSDSDAEPKPGNVYEDVRKALEFDLNTPLAMELIDKAVNTLKSDQYNNELKADILSAKMLLGFK